MSERYLWKISKNAQKPQLEAKNAESTERKFSENLDSEPKTQTGSDKDVTSSKSGQKAPLIEMVVDRIGNSVPDHLHKAFTEIKTGSA